ncbi:hypothetical protein NQZ68_000027 [Dissostichus eleginoides]|nr:hypothetical protein NQZ68_000027 [Dissostichus eleginoides]
MEGYGDRTTKQYTLCMATQSAHLTPQRSQMLPTSDKQLQPKVTPCLGQTEAHKQSQNKPALDFMKVFEPPPPCNGERQPYTFDGKQNNDTAHKWMLDVEGKGESIAFRDKEGRELQHSRMPGIQQAALILSGLVQVEKREATIGRLSWSSERQPAKPTHDQSAVNPRTV